MTDDVAVAALHRAKSSESSPLWRSGVGDAVVPVQRHLVVVHDGVVQLVSDRPRRGLQREREMVCCLLSSHGLMLLRDEW